MNNLWTIFYFILAFVGLIVAARTDDLWYGIAGIYALIISKWYFDLIERYRR